MFKDWLKKRFEKNTVEINNLSWTSKKNNQEIKHIDEVVYLKRSRIPFTGDWGRVYHPLNEKTDKINWSNFLVGGRKNFFKLLFVMFCLAMIYLFVVNTLGASKEYMNGQKYVIIEKDLFTKYCSVGQDMIKVLPSNLTIVRSNFGG